MRTFVIAIAMAAVLNTTAGFAQTTQNNRAAASGNNNQAVATTDANALMPAAGSNSFTTGQAKTRIEKEGFSNVSDLSKDNNGIWHGKANKDGTTTTVWLDYKGNVGQAK